MPINTSSSAFKPASNSDIAVKLLSGKHIVLVFGIHPESYSHAANPGYPSKKIQPPEYYAGKTF